MQIPIWYKNEIIGHSTIDDEDFENIALKKKWRLCCNTKTRKGYVGITSYYRKKITILLLHRIILKAKPHEIVDHIDKNTWNNKKENLRIVSHYGNTVNKTRSRNKTSSMYYRVQKGSSKGFRAELKFNYKNIKFHVAKSEVEAAMFYDWVAKIYHGDYASLNFPNQHTSFTIKEVF